MQLGRIMLLLSLIVSPAIAIAGDTATVTSTRAPVGVPAEPIEASASAEAPRELQPARIAVTFRHQPLFFIADDGTARSKIRAGRLSEALQSAVQSPALADQDAPNVEMVLSSTSAATLSVRGHLVGELQLKDARAAGYSDLASYARSLEDGLGLFVADQRRRVALQAVALSVFFALAILVGGLLLLRLVRHLFRRADDYLDDRSGSLRPISVLGVPIIGAEALSAAAALAVAIGRIAAYLGIIAATVALALARFETTRPWVGDAVRWATTPIVTGIEELMLALPRLALAALLLVLASGGLRVARILFDEDGVSRTSWGPLSPERARVLRIIASTAVILVIAPLAVAAVFGRFHTPLELLIVAAAASGTLALSPLLASGAVGLLTIWRRSLTVGEVVRVRGLRGRVVSLTPWDVEIEDDGGRTMLPMLSLLSAHVIHGERAGTARLRVVARRAGEVRTTVDGIRRALAELDPSIEVTCQRFDHSEVEVTVSRAEGPIDGDDMLLRLSDPELDRGLEILGARVERS